MAGKRLCVCERECVTVKRNYINADRLLFLHFIARTHRITPSSDFRGKSNAALLFSPTLGLIHAQKTGLTGQTAKINIDSFRSMLRNLASGCSCKCSK